MRNPWRNLREFPSRDQLIRRLINELLPLTISLWLFLILCECINNLNLTYQPLSINYIEPQKIELLISTEKTQINLLKILTILIPILSIITVKINNKMEFKGNANNFLLKVLIYSLTIFLLIEINSFISYITIYINKGFLRNKYVYSSINFERQLTTILSQFNIILIPIPFLICFIYIIYKSFISKFMKIKIKIPLEIEPSENINFYDFLVLILTSFLTILITYYPFSLKHNLFYDFYWCDLLRYADMIIDVKSKDSLSSIIGYTFLRYRDRPLSILFITLFEIIFGLPTIESLKILIILIPLLVHLSTCYFILKIRGIPAFNRYLLMFLSSISFQITVAQHAGLLSNLFALIPLYIFLGSLISLNRSKSKFIFETFLLFSIIFFHSYTWFMIIFILLTFLIFIYLNDEMRANYRLFIREKFIIISLNIFFGFVRDIIYRNFYWIPAPEAYSVLEAKISLNNLFYYFKILSKVFEKGFEPFNNFFIFFFSIFGIIFLVFVADDILSNLLFSWFGVFFVLLLFSDSSITYRLLYVTPFHLVAPYFLNIFYFSKNRSFRIVGFLLCSIMIFGNINFAFRSGFILSKVI